MARAPGRDARSGTGAGQPRPAAPGHWQWHRAAAAWSRVTDGQESPGTAIGGRGRRGGAQADAGACRIETHSLSGLLSRSAESGPSHGPSRLPARWARVPSQPFAISLSY